MATHTRRRQFGVTEHWPCCDEWSARHDREMWESGEYAGLAFDKMFDEQPGMWLMVGAVGEHANRILWPPKDSPRWDRILVDAQHYGDRGIPDKWCEECGQRIEGTGWLNEETDESQQERQSAK